MAAQDLPNADSISITPDLVSQVLGRLAGADGAVLTGGGEGRVATGGREGRVATGGREGRMVEAAEATSLHPRAVQAYRRTEYEELVVRHGTRQQAAFFLASRGRDIADLFDQHGQQYDVRQQVAAAIPADWRRAEVERRVLPRFAFVPEDVIVVVGQDGLVANTAKYLLGQPVIGVNGDSDRNPGVLVPYGPEGG